MDTLAGFRIALFCCVCFLELSSHVATASYNRPDVNCSASQGTDRSAKLACYTCMGRDSENCDWGTVCCKGSCFKLVDQEHDIIAKGCTNDAQEDGSMRKRETRVELYWADNEKLKGQTYYCDSHDYCNGVGAATASLISAVVSVAVVMKLLA